MPFTMLTKFKEISVCAILGCLMFLGACKSYKNVPYFINLPDSLYDVTNHNGSVFIDPKIQPNDILQISMQTIDPQVANVLGGVPSAETTPSASASSSLSQAGAGGGQDQQIIPGYLVDKDGYIELPLVGKIKVGGLTTAEARDNLTAKASVYYKNPVINVRLANFTVSVLGEVAHPSRYIVPNEKFSVLDALAEAGDLTIFGRRENVLLIRDVNGEKKSVRFNLNSTDIFRSPYFYLKQGDVVYVEPSKAKSASTDAVVARNYSLAAAVLTIIIVIITRVK